MKIDYLITEKWSGQNWTCRTDFAAPVVRLFESLSDQYLASKLVLVYVGTSGRSFKLSLVGDVEEMFLFCRRIEQDLQVIRIAGTLWYLHAIKKPGDMEFWKEANHFLTAS